MNKTCESCEFFESRTQFCRKNPPTPIAVSNGTNSYITVSFPKIQMPQLDFCSKYEQKKENQIL